MLPKNLYPLNGLNENFYVLKFTADGLVKSCNELFCDEMGVNEVRLIGESIIDLITDLHRQTFFKSIREKLDKGVKEVSGEVQLRTRDNSLKWMHYIFSKDYSAANVEYQMIGFDCTDTKMMEERLRILEFASELGTWDWHLQTNQINFDSKWCEILGYSVSEIEHSFETWEDLVHEEDRDGAKNAFMNYLESHEKPFEHIMRMRHKLGYWVWILSKGKIVEWDDEGNPLRFNGTHLDFSSHKKIEEELESERVRAFQSSKLATLGEMAGGIAHEVNTPMATIGLTVDYIRGQLEEDVFDIDDINKRLEMITQTVDRVGRIIRGLRDFARQDGNEPLEKMSLHDLVEDVFALCKEKLYTRGIEVRLNFDSDLMFKARRVQLSQVLLNLISNSHDAICELENRWIEVTAKIEGSNVVIQYSDSGKGIPQNVVKKMFDPFYTTKPVGKGTGLGMSISSTIIGAHKGKMRYNEVNGHTGFEITFPHSLKVAPKNDDAA